MSSCNVLRCTSKGCTGCREFVISCVTNDGTVGWLNTVSLHLMKKAPLLFMLNCAGCPVTFGCYH